MPEQTPKTSMGWLTVAQVVGAVAGGAAWVQLVGAAVLWARLNRIGVSPTSSVGLLPRDLSYLFILGVHALIFPFIGAAAALGALVYLNPPKKVSTGRRRLSAPDVRPKRCNWVLGGLGVAALIYVVLLPLSAGWTLAMIAAGALGIAAIYGITYRTETLAATAAALFISVAAFGGLLGLGAELGEKPQLDLSVVLRKDGSAIGGFFVARTNDTVYLVTAVRPSGNENSEIIGGSPDAHVTPPDQPCRGAPPVADHAEYCYVREIVAVPTSEIVKFSLGPRSIRVNATGFSAARVLARVALLKKDEEQPAPAPSKPG